MAAFTGVWAGHGMGGDFDYFKFIAETVCYMRSAGHVIAVRLMGGIATGDMPYNDLFTLGGADTRFAAMKDDEFRGNKMYEATVEYRYPIAKNPRRRLYRQVMPGAA